MYDWMYATGIALRAINLLYEFSFRFDFSVMLYYYIDIDTYRVKLDVVPRVSEISTLQLLHFA